MNLGHLASNSPRVRIPLVRVCREAGTGRAVCCKSATAITVQQGPRGTERESRKTFRRLVAPLHDPPRYRNELWFKKWVLIAHLGSFLQREGSQRGLQSSSTLGKASLLVEVPSHAPGSPQCCDRYGAIGVPIPGPLPRVIPFSCSRWCVATHHLKSTDQDNLFYLPCCPKYQNPNLLERLSSKYYQTNEVL